MTLHILIVDDQAIVRAGIARLLDGQPDLQVVGEAADGDAAILLARQLRPEVVLMDIRMPHVDGIAATRRIVDSSDARVLMLTTYDLDEYVYLALQAGASGFLLKDTPPDRLREAVRVVGRGDALVEPSVLRRLIASFTPPPEASSPDPRRLAALTTRESEVLSQIARGLSNSEIAEELFVSEATVRTHVGHVYAKLDVRDRAQAVVAAYEHGLVVPGR